jgi:hypothetical protein
MNQYRIYCNSETGFIQGYGTTGPTGCYNNLTHSVNINSIGQVDYASTLKPIAYTNTIPVPLLGITADSSRSMLQTYEGGVYFMNKPNFFNYVLFRTGSNGVGANTIRISIYQTLDGGMATSSYQAILKSHISTSITATTNTNFTGSSNVLPCPLSDGYIYILFGRELATATKCVAYSGVTVSLINSNMSNGAIPAVFSTNITVNNTPPSTFDPTAAAASLGGPLICRLLL